MACTALYGEACEFPSCLWTHFFFGMWISQLFMNTFFFFLVDLYI